MAFLTYTLFDSVVATPGGGDFSTLAAGWPTGPSLNGSGSVSCTSAAACNGGMGVGGFAHDDGVMEPYVNVTAISLSFGWSVSANRSNGNGFFRGFGGNTPQSFGTGGSGTNVTSDMGLPPTFTRSDFFGSKFSWSFILGQTSAFSAGTFTFIVSGATITVTYDILPPPTPPTEIDITGSGGATISGPILISSLLGVGSSGSRSTYSPAMGVQAGTPPELHGNQWGLLRFDVRPREEEAQ